MILSQMNNSTTLEAIMNELPADEKNVFSPITVSIAAYLTASIATLVEYYVTVYPHNNSRIPPFSSHSYINLDDPSNKGTKNNINMGGQRNVRRDPIPSDIGESMHSINIRLPPPRRSPGEETRRVVSANTNMKN